MTTRKWSQPKCPSAEKYTMKIWYTCTTEYHSTAKARESVKWMDLESIILSGGTQTQKDKNYISSLICRPYNVCAHIICMYTYLYIPLYTYYLYIPRNWYPGNLLAVAHMGNL